MHTTNIPTLSAENDIDYTQKVKFEEIQKHKTLKRLKIEKKIQKHKTLKRLKIENIEKVEN